MNKKLFTITLVFVLCCFMATSAWATRKVELTSGTAQQFMSQLNQNKGFDSTSLASIFGLSADEKLDVLRSRTDFNRVTHYRYQQTYKGIPVWGMQTVIGMNPGNEAVRLHGTLVMDIPNEIGAIPGNLDPGGALRKMKNNHMKSDKNAVWNFENEEYGTYIYIKKNGKAKLCYVVSFFADNENGNPSRMVYFVNAKNGNVIHSYDNLQWADGTGPGGNLKIGEYYYGPTGDYPAFGVTVAGSTCTMSTTDVKTVNMNHGTSGSTAYSYTCYENTHKEINGAYCPLNDAQYFGQVVYDMYQDWYGVPVLPFQLMMRVHYSTNYENAFWNGSSMTFGDGYSTFHPLVCLDVSAHEVAHGFTDNHSDLIYSGQSGGINEAYSDMAGESAEYYSRGTNDFMCGYDIFKAAGQALRYLYDPPLDGISIDHVDDYYSGMDVHYSSGVYNKVFYLLAVTSGWDTQKSFDIFTKANMDYWTPSTTFQSGAEGARDAALDYGYNCGDVVAAFAAVGITIDCPGPPVADFSGTPTSGGAPLTVNFTDLSTNSPNSWSWDFGDTGTATTQNPGHTYTASGTYTVSLTVSNANGSDTETKTGYITVLAPQPPIAEFSASSTNISMGDTVTFTDESINTPTSWAWTFDGGTPGSSSAQNPSVTYNTVGTYTVSLTATNAQGSDTETKTGYITVAEKPYCTSSAGNQGYEYIAGVSVADLNNTSGASPYTDYTSLTATMSNGETVSVSLTPGFVSSSYTEYWKIWIDYNGDHDFEDSGEEVFSGSGSSTVTGSFTVPSSTVGGDTRMRVSMSYSSYPPYCGTFTYGEVEDYTVSFGVVFPVADFIGTPTTVNVGGSVAFTDLSSGSPTAWAWSFPGGTPSSSTAQNPTVVYNTAGVYSVTLAVTNAAGSDTETRTDYITVIEVPDPPVADFIGTPTTVNVGGSVAFTDTSTIATGVPTSWSWSFPGGTPSSSTAQNPTVVYNTVGTYDVTLTATNADGSDSETKINYITVNDILPNLVFESGTVSGVGSSWQSVTLVNTYTSPVVVCSTGIADSSASPVVVRVKDAAGNSFEVRVQNPSGTVLSGHTVHYVVVEEGVYTAAEDGVTMEAVKANSTVTARKGSWTMEARSYQNSYTSPVVVGQVMTADDSNEKWSVFWACGASRNAPPSATALNAGREIAEDTDYDRADETIGYIVIEQGSGTVNGIPYTAGLGADTVRGPGNTSTGYTYNFTSVGTASAAIVSTAAIDGGNGGWPVLYGSNPYTASSITTVVDEDQIGDAERNHTTEQVAYIVFGL